MDWSRRWELLVLLVALLEQGGALLCPHCSSGHCQLLPCPSPNATCRRTSLSQRRGGAVLVQEEGGCDVFGPPDLTLTFRSHGELLTLSERRGPGGDQGETAPEPRQGGLSLRCLSCDASDGSCGRPLVALPCPRPGDYCLDVSSHVRGQVGEGRLRGCGRAGPCQGLLALDTGGGRQVALRCCQHDQCDTEAEPLPPASGLRCWGWDGPGTPRGDPQVVTCGGGLTHCGLAWSYGPSGEPWLLRGCVTPSWCQTPLGLGVMWGSPIATPLPPTSPPGPTAAPRPHSDPPDPLAPPTCCQGSFCNRLPGDPPAPSSAPRLPPPCRRLLLLPLVVRWLWG